MKVSTHTCPNRKILVQLTAHGTLAGINFDLNDQGMLETSTATRTGLYLSSPTKGEMELVVGNIWEVKENDLPEFEWVPSVSGITSDVERRVAGER